MPFIPAERGVVLPIPEHRIAQGCSAVRCGAVLRQRTGASIVTGLVISGCGTQMTIIATPSSIVSCASHSPEPSASHARAWNSTSRKLRVTYT